MRFANLSLERYGHFEDCQLTFRAGPPDLHVIYGPNEAGKTTSMAAVSDLLFGFPARSPYNFIYDYSLLRVGAVLEDDGKSLAFLTKVTSGNNPAALNLYIQDKLQKKSTDTITGNSTCTPGVGA